jgi:hypothetical protein
MGSKDSGRKENIEKKKGYGRDNGSYRERSTAIAYVSGVYATGR